MTLVWSSSPQRPISTVRSGQGGYTGEHREVQGNTLNLREHMELRGTQGTQGMTGNTEELREHREHMKNRQTQGMTGNKGKYRDQRGHRRT